MYCSLKKIKFYSFTVKKDEHHVVQYKVQIQTINYLPPSAAYTRERHLHAQSTPYKLKQ